MSNRIETEVVQAFGRKFVKGNIPEVNPVRCLGCRHCVNLCRKLGPNVLDIVEGVAKAVRPSDCIGDGACMMACPTKARGTSAEGVRGQLTRSDLSGSLAKPPRTPRWETILVAPLCAL